MSAANFERYMREQYFQHEGPMGPRGFVNHPRDPGGATQSGVTQAVYDGWRVEKGLPKRDVRQITMGELQPIIREGYWNAIRGDDFPAGIDTVTVDAVINSGPSQGAKFTQRALRVDDDGVVGPNTLDAANDAPDKVAVIRGAVARRISFWQSLRNGQMWKDFGIGWARRGAEIEAFSVTLALAAAGRPQESIVAANESAAAEASTSAKKNTAAAGTTGAAAAGDGAAVVDAVSGTGAEELVMTGIDWVIIGGLVLLAVIAAYFAYRAIAQKQRRTAYQHARVGVTENGTVSKSPASSKGAAPKRRNRTASKGR